MHPPEPRGRGHVDSRYQSPNNTQVELGLTIERMAMNIGIRRRCSPCKWDQSETKAFVALPARPQTRTLPEDDAEDTRALLPTDDTAPRNGPVARSRDRPTAGGLRASTRAAPRRFCDLLPSFASLSVFVPSAEKAAQRAAEEALGRGKEPL